MSQGVKEGYCVSGAKADGIEHKWGMLGWLHGLVVH